MNPTDQSIGVSNVNWPRHMVPIQLKNLMPVGTAIRYVRKEKKGSSTAPVANMWCAQTLKDRKPIPNSAKTMPFVAEERFAAEDGNDLADDAEERQRDDVHLGMAEEPEQVLPEHAAAVLAAVHQRTQLAIGQQREQGRGQRREGHQDEDAGDED